MDIETKFWVLFATCLSAFTVTLLVHDFIRHEPNSTLVVSEIQLPHNDSLNFQMPSEEDVFWVALNIYHEARSENFFEKIRIAHVTMNRVSDRRFPNTVRGVVTDHKQFSWYSDGLSDTPHNKSLWAHCRSLAESVLVQDVNGYRLDITKGSTHYHTKTVNPYWAASLTPVSLSDSTHKFYRWES